MLVGAKQKVGWVPGPSKGPAQEAMNKLLHGRAGDPSYEKPLKVKATTKIEKDNFLSSTTIALGNKSKKLDVTGTNATIIIKGDQ